MPAPTTITMLRWVVVAAQGSTLCISWPLWQPRTSPPLLPVTWLGDVPQLPFGAVLLASLLIVLRWPVAGALLHSLLLGAALLLDQTREQPQVLSLALLLWATVPSATGEAVGAAHLVALWFWSGLGKLLSPRFRADGGAFLLGLLPGMDSTGGTVAAIALGTGEVALALLALWPRTRRVAVCGGVLLHLVILLVLSPLLRDLNPSVWPWNAALLVAVPVLLRQAATPPRQTWLQRTLIAVVTVLLPLGFHAGIVDWPFASQVYTMPEPRALVLEQGGATRRIDLLVELHVFLPPVPRIQIAHFAHVARPGDQLVLLEPRPLARWLFGGDRLLDAPATAASGKAHR